MLKIKKVLLAVITSSCLIMFSTINVDAKSPRQGDLFADTYKKQDDIYSEKREIIEERWKENRPENCTKEGKFVKYGKEVVRTKEVDGWMWGFDDRDYNTDAYAIYEVGQIEAPYFSKIKGYRVAGSTVTIEEEKTEIIAYVKGFEQTVNSKIKMELSSELSDSIFNQANMSAEVKNEFKESFKLEVKCESRNLSRDTMPINEDGYYFDQLRATYTIYEVQEYTIINERKERHREKAGWWAWNIYYDVYQVFECTNVYYIASFNTDCGRCITKYKQTSDGKFVYDGPKSNSEIIYV
jgi:transcriptional regulator with PAS, ATPase and Fis domain